MPKITAVFALAAMLASASLLQACSTGTPAGPAGERSGAYGSTAPDPVNEFPQARNASPYMRQ